MPAARSRGRERDANRPKPRSDAYVGLLAVSLLALTAAMLFAFLNWNTYPEGKPKPVQMAPRAQGPAQGAPPAMPVAPAAPGANPAAPQPGGPAPAPMPMPMPAPPKQ